MLREASLACLVLAAALAGCLEAPAAGRDAGEEAAALAGASNATAPGAEWHVLPVRAGPDTPLAAFWWTVPSWAVVPDEVFAFTGQDWTTVVLEVALLGPEEDLEKVQAWALFAMVDGEDGLHPVAEVHAMPYHSLEHGLQGAEAREEETFRDPFHLRIGPDVVSANETVGLVVAARAEAPVDLRLAFRALSKDPGWDKDPAKDADAFVAAREGRPPVPLAQVGGGAGLQTALFLELQGLSLLPHGYEMWTDAVLRDGGASPDARPLGAVRDQTLSASYASPEGYGSSFGAYFASHAVGEWSAEADVRGEALSVGGPIATGPATFPAMLLLGFPYHAAVGEGNGTSASSFHVDTVALSAGGLELLLFLQVDLGATLQTLLGKDAMTFTGHYGGLLGERAMGAAAWADGRHVVLAAPGQPGPVRMLLGALPHA